MPQLQQTPSTVGIQALANGTVNNSTLHSTIPKILGSSLLTNKSNKPNEDLIFIDLKKTEQSGHFRPQTPTSFFQHDTHLDIINWTPYLLTEDELSVLQLGLGFCPLDPLIVTETIKDLYLFACNLTFKYIFDKDRGQLNLERELAYRRKETLHNGGVLGTPRPPASLQ